MTAYIFDSETTGLNNPELVEAAWLQLGAVLAVTGEFLQRYKPSKPIELGALATSHILDEELVECPPHDSFKLPEDATYLIGHNVDYDWGGDRQAGYQAHLHQGPELDALAGR